MRGNSKTDQQGDPRHLETLDRDLGRLSNLEMATSYVGRPLVAPGISLVFVVLAGLAALLFFGQTTNSMIVVIAACLGAYNRASLNNASLNNALLNDASLDRASLDRARGNMAEIKSMQFDKWPVVWTTAPNGVVTLQIGCQRHALDLWEKSDQRWIKAMDPEATEWWAKYRDIVLSLVKSSPAKPWGMPT